MNLKSLIVPMAVLWMTTAQVADFNVVSKSQINGSFSSAQFANAMGCTGENLSPHVAWQGAPQGTKSYVVTMYDPDSTGSGSWHWVVANIPASVTELKEGAGSEGGAMPQGALAVRGDNGIPGYAGICPPAGQTHNYVITVHALKVEKLDLPPHVTPAMLGFMTLDTGLDKATLTIKGGPQPKDGLAKLQATGATLGTERKQVPGSTRQYTQVEIDNPYAAPDWFPDQHASMPKLVSHGDGGKVQACASCHLASGLGHPESGNLAGLPQSYLVRQLAEYKSRIRFEPSPMHAMASAMSEQQMQEVSAYFSSLKPVRSSRVEEAGMVPQTAIHPSLRMRQVVSNGGMEPIDGRLIEVPEFPERVEMRDPNAGFVAYVPLGSIALGKTLATEGGGRTIPCMACHGEHLKGTAEVPRLAGLSPDYVLRQLQAFKSGDRRGAQAPQMKPAVENLTVADMIAISAYVGTLDPNLSRVE